MTFYHKNYKKTKKKNQQRLKLDREWINQCDLKIEKDKWNNVIMIEYIYGYLLVTTSFSEIFHDATCFTL